MDSPIIILVFWVIINLLLKSSKDKKKAEQARNKSRQKSPGTMDTRTSKPQRNSGMKDFRKALEEYKAQIERELNPDKRVSTKPEPVKTTRTEPTSVPKRDNGFEMSRTRGSREGLYMDEVELETPDQTQEIGKQVTPLSSEAVISTGKQGKFLDVKNDILKGIVYSEILDKPKSLKHKRGPF